MNKTIGLYIHIPFCKNKCLYCDFFSKRAACEDYDTYLTELNKKIKYWSNKINNTVSSIYFGGGTPSILGTNRLCSLLDEIKNNFYIAENAEITVEINPESGKNLDFKKMYKCGFNRLSIGMQTSAESELKALGRIHNITDVSLTIDNAKKAGFNNISLDLMIGIPNQTTNTLKKSIDFCIEKEVTHISSYILKLEENTPFFSMKNSLNLADDDEQAEMYLFSVEYLEKFGYKQYEVSNFSLDGYESKHNLNYWKCGEYIGIGPSAHSFYNGKRFNYERSMEKFKENITIFDGYGGSEDEYVMLSLRLKSGLDFSDYEKRYNKNISKKFLNKAEKYVKAEYMQLDENKLCFTPKGFLVSNSIICDLIL